MRTRWGNLEPSFSGQRRSLSKNGSDSTLQTERNSPPSRNTRESPSRTGAIFRSYFSSTPQTPAPISISRFSGNRPEIEQR